MPMLGGLLGDPGSDQAQAIGLLSAGLINGNFGNGLLAANQVFSPEAQMKRQLGTLQLQNLQSEIATRKAALEKQGQIQKLLSDSFGGSASPSPAAPGQLGSGSFGVVPPPAGQPMIPQASAPTGGSGRIGTMSPDTLALLKANGLDLVDVAKLARPDMQVSNGYAYDKNNVRQGFLPQLNVSQNGQATMVQVGPDGQPVVSAPNGSLPAYSAFRNADEAAKAAYDPVKVYNPATKREEFAPRSQVVGPTGAPAAQPGVTGNFKGDPAKIMEAIVNIKDPQERVNAMAAFTEQARRTNGFAQGASFAAGPSTDETNTAAAQKAYGENVAKDVVEQRKSIMQADFSAPSNIAKMQRIGQLLQDVDGGRLTPTGTELASTLNSVGIKIDKNLGNKQAAAAMANEMALQLRSPQGGAGMPGALSDRDREFLASMTPSQTQSLEGRKQIIDAYVGLQRRNQQIAQFARNYEKKYGQLNNGFFDQLSAWSNSNPLFGSK